jgi:hypothetical protein
MDLARAVALIGRLLDLGLMVEAALTAGGGYVVKVTGGETPATGVGDSYLDAFWRATWRWTQS